MLFKIVEYFPNMYTISETVRLSTSGIIRNKK